MPNGWYPVPGLDVVYVNRSEQRFPRTEWLQSDQRFAAFEVATASGFVPNDGIDLSRESFPELVDEVRKLVGRPRAGYNGPISGSLVLIDFAARVGWAVGRFAAYGFGDAGVTVLHDHSLGGALPARGAAAAGIPLDLPLSAIEGSGLVEHSGVATPGSRFELGASDAVVVSNVPIHFDAHWPPRTSLDAVAIVLAGKQRRDALIALWRQPEAAGSGE